MTKPIDFLRAFSNISPAELEEMLEWMDDRKLLSKKGKELRHSFWEEFIKEDD